MEYEEVDVPFVVVNKLHPNFILSVCERTVLPILAILTVVGIVSTKFSFVFFDRVQLFNLVVALPAMLAIGTCKVVLLIFDMLSHSIFTF